MKTIVEALQDLYVAMGGEESDVSELTLNPDVIEQIAELVESGETKELPAVTAADNDKVLTVVNGAWDKAEASGELGRFDVNVSTQYETDHFVITDFDKTNEQILSAYNAGMVVVAHTSMMGSRQSWQLIYATSVRAVFTYCDLMGNSGTIGRMELAESSSINVKTQI